MCCKQINYLYLVWYELENKNKIYTNLNISRHSGVNISSNVFTQFCFHLRSWLKCGERHKTILDSFNLNHCITISTTRVTLQRNVSFPPQPVRSLSKLTQILHIPLADYWHFLYWHCCAKSLKSPADSELSLYHWWRKREREGEKMANLCWTGLCGSGCL